MSDHEKDETKDAGAGDTEAGSGPGPHDPGPKTGTRKKDVPAPPAE